MEHRERSSMAPSTGQQSKMQRAMSMQRQIVMSSVADDLPQPPNSLGKKICKWKVFTLLTFIFSTSVDYLGSSEPNGLGDPSYCTDISCFSNV